LTYKSIRDVIVDHEAAGNLTRFAPQSRRPLVRALFLTTEALKIINDPCTAINILVGRGRIIAAMEKWVRGERIHANEGQGTFLKKLEGPPPEIWEMRITEPSVQARLFARFASPSTLIVTDLYTRQLLGKKMVRGKKSQHWSDAMTKCEASWNALFPRHQPFSGDSVHAYITENCDDFEI
jgi:hypothetical protein